MQELWELVQKRVPRGQRDVHAEQGDDGTKEVSVKNPGPGAGVAKFSRFVEFSAGTHNDTCVQHGYWSAIAEFLDSLDSISPPPPAKI